LSRCRERFVARGVFGHKELTQRRARCERLPHWDRSLDEKGALPVAG
jgi:hypothetical protein